MAEKKSTEITTTKEEGNNSNTNPNPIFSLISKFQGFFNLPPPPPKQNDDAVVSNQKTEEVKPAAEAEEPKSWMMKMQPRGQAEMPSLRLEGEEQCREQETNPIVLWQVYAIGGYFVIRWILAKWNEKRTKKPPSDEEPSPADD